MGAMSEPDPERLRELGSKLDAVQKREVKRREPPNNAAGIILRLATELVAAPIIGAAIGLGLDWLFSTRPLLTIVMFLLGAVAGIRNVMRTARELNARDQKRVTDQRE
jgi:ATP synthase protein I